MKGRELINTQRMRRQSRIKGTPRVASLGLTLLQDTISEKLSFLLADWLRLARWKTSRRIYLKSDPFQSILSPSVSAQEALSNHNKAMIPLFSQPVNHSSQCHTPSPSAGLCSAAPPAGLSSSARLHSFTNLNISPTSNYHQKNGDFVYAGTHRTRLFVV